MNFIILELVLMMNADTCNKLIEEYYPLIEAKYNNHRVNYCQITLENIQTFMLMLHILSLAFHSE